MAGNNATLYNPTSKPNSTTSFFKKSKLTYGLVIFLCTFSYLFGSWQQSTRRVTTADLGATIPCTTSSSSSSVSFSEKASTTNNNNNLNNKPLDFASHHSADRLTGTGTVGIPDENVKVYPPCPANMTEYTPCEDNKRSLKFPRDRLIYIFLERNLIYNLRLESFERDPVKNEHRLNRTNFIIYDRLIYRERHCPTKGELLKCRIPAPYGYKTPFKWPMSRDLAWYANAPHKELTVEKAVQNWIRYEGDRFRFPGGGTGFPKGADAYIDEIGKMISLTDGSIRTAIDTGCGVASWGAYLLSRNVLTMSFAPRDTHISQVQFALERGVPALLGIIASKRLPYPSRAFDMAHCSRCLIPWGQNDGVYLLEVDRILRPGGYWILSGPPINWKRYWKGWERTKEDLNEEQTQIEKVAESLCWNKLGERGDIAIWQKPINHLECKANRQTVQKPQFCPAQNPDSGWYTPIETCLTPLPEVSDEQEVAGGELANWPKRLEVVPPRISSGSIKGVTPEIFHNDAELWKKRVSYYKTVNSQLGQPGRYRNLLDMNAYLGGFAAALIKDPSWVMNIVPVEAKVDTLGAIYQRGLIGTYQSWCEAMSTYPRTYDLIHADSVFTLYKDRCEMEDILLEMDRILRPEGSVIIRDDVDVLVKVKRIADGLLWDSQIVDHEDGPLEREKLMFAVKLYWTAPAESDQQGSNSKS